MRATPGNLRGRKPASGRWYLRRGSMQFRRKIGRKYVLVYGWSALAVGCALLALVAGRYFAGTLDGHMAGRYAAGIAASLALSGVLIFAAKSG